MMPRSASRKIPNCCRNSKLTGLPINAEPGTSDTTIFFSKKKLLDNTRSFIYAPNPYYGIALVLHRLHRKFNFKYQVVTSVDIDVIKSPKKNSTLKTTRLDLSLLSSEIDMLPCICKCMFAYIYIYIYILPCICI